MPKIREIDALIDPDHQKRLSEAHPEIAFWRLNGRTPCQFSKRKKQGQVERRRLLIKNGLKGPDAHFERLRRHHQNGVRLDDVYDACALALTAKARLEGAAVRLTDGARDAQGLCMEIWG